MTGPITILRRLLATALLGLAAQASHATNALSIFGSCQLSTHASSVNAQGYASFGALGARVNATANNSAASTSAALASNHANAHILVEFGDTLTFVGGPLPVLAQQSNMSWSLSVYTPDTTFTQAKELNTNPEHPNAQLAVLTPVTLAIPVVFGQPTFVHAALTLAGLCALRRVSA